MIISFFEAARLLSSEKAELAEGAEVTEEAGSDSFKVIEGEQAEFGADGFEDVAEASFVGGFRGGKRNVMPVFPGTRTLKLAGALGLFILGTSATGFVAKGAAVLIELGGTTFLFESRNFTYGYKRLIHKYNYL